MAALKELVAFEGERFLTPAIVARLFRDGPLASHLEVLRLGTEAIGWPVAELARGVKMPKLRVLVLPSASAPVGDWKRLARLPVWEHVRVVSLFDDDEEAIRDEFHAALRKRLPPDGCRP